MPTYEYKCDACGAKFEKFQSIKADAIKTCPTCGKDSARRLISAGAGIIFKGSGFYTTDYRDKGYSDQAKADSGEKSADTKESKPAAETKPSDTKSAEPKPAESKPAETPKADPKPAKTESPAAT